MGCKKMKKLPIKPVVLPAHLKGCKPGKLDEAVLVRLEKGGKLEKNTADAWNAMVSSAKFYGVELKPTSVGDVYRTFDSQLAGFMDRYVLEDTGTGKSRKFRNKTWYLKKGKAPMAAPGTSNHNLGIAIDVANANGKILEWLLANADDYGFTWELQEEPWHIRYVCGDAIPAKVKAWKEAQNATA
jgi:LAS superfamily LD-carboxypeptidase LdcB